MTDIFPAPVSVENPLVPSIKQFPSSSLGAFWLLKELFRPEPFSGDLSRYFQNVANSLKRAKDRGLPLIIRCQEATSIHHAILFARSVEMPLIIMGTIESPQLVDIFKENDIPVIIEADVRPNGLWMPEDSADTRERQIRMKNISLLIQQGICVALTVPDEKYLPDLFWAALYFQKFGLSCEDIVKTITLNPARIFGLGDRIGSLGEGKDADILFFKKEIGLPLPALKKVMSEGKIVHEEK
jgi:imidazolonepropionase-like amidohydrolase